MATRYIYLPEDLNERLKKEHNASGLIQSLLLKHYDIKTLELSKLSAKEITEKIAETEKKIRAYTLLDDEKNIKLLEEELKVLHTHIDKHIEEQKQAQRDQEMIKYYNFTWTPELSEEYRQGIASKKWRSSVEFIKTKLESQALNGVAPTTQ